MPLKTNRVLGYLIMSTNSHKRQMGGHHHIKINKIGRRGKQKLGSHSTKHPLLPQRASNSIQKTRITKSVHTVRLGNTYTSQNLKRLKSTCTPPLITITTFSTISNRQPKHHHQNHKSIISL